MQGIVCYLPRLIIVSASSKEKKIVSSPTLEFVDELGSYVRIKLQHPFPDSY